MPNPISRRSLLGAAGAAAALAPAGARAAGPETDKVGFAIVGLGKLSLGQLIPGLKVAKGAKLAAVVSGHPDKARRVAAENGLPADAVYGYDDYDRMAQDPRIQVVYIVLPNALHAEHTIKALKAGKHVLCEKPMATTIADAEAMIAAAKATNRHLMIAYRCHYEPLNLDVMRRLRAKSLGRVRQINTTMGRQADPSDPSDAWRLDAALSGAGALGDMGVYGISAARYLLNEEPVAVQAWAWTDPADPRFKETQDLINWQFRFPSGVIANGSTSFAYAPTMAFEAICEQGRLVADPAAFYGGNRLTVVKGGQAQPPVPAPPVDQFAREMDWMADVVRGKAPMVSPGEEGLQDMRLMQAILDSAAKDGATVRTDWGYRRAVDPAAVVDIA
ncbi:Gfo/Idh/MocA family protein [Caulobacter rhizosphaerae]|jgi:predicted dehydrogenase|uniref:Dehydrogenase n=1 Tax=Caulobacter rhizosphaerae TaxID=2010972 RepID=A0ABU1MX06_9CAUL|nr:Gfo/Idh/MocA family oxidoreductase [Caulobacter rhizosphaerae]MDR6530385.1 putative dehydrogenase [Caulobacter rhizosphaerae]GGL31868.1 glucose-fructose oxidoreductase [Caulobacter rhizosphaerae]